MAFFVPDSEYLLILQVSCHVFAVLAEAAHLASKMGNEAKIPLWIAS
jgi:hypothetical protein